MTTRPFYTGSLFATACFTLWTAAQGPLTTSVGSAGVTSDEARILSHLSLVNLPDGQGGTHPTLRIEGVNVQLVNGLNATNGFPSDPYSVGFGVQTNGLGNLIVGYADSNSGTSPPERTGSHNVVLGVRTSWASFGGLSSGFFNHTDQPHSATVGGLFAGSFGVGAVTVAGGGPTTWDRWGLAAGGKANSAFGDTSSCLGGEDNQAFDAYATVVGGESHLGAFNASVFGGSDLSADDSFAVAAGGMTNSASGELAVVVGGSSQFATGDDAVVLGGAGNAATSDSTTACGGASNKAEAIYATVAGGLDGLASGDYSCVSGGQDNTASGIAASVSGGEGNAASGTYSCLGGGSLGVAGSVAASVCGGFHCDALGAYSTVSGGSNRAVTGTYDWRAGTLFETN